MARPKVRDFKPVNFNLEVGIHEKLERYCEETGLTKTKAIERVLDRFLKDYFERETQKEG